MAKPHNKTDELLEKLQSLSPAKISEVHDFVEFLASRDNSTVLGQAATRLSEKSFATVWDNADDADYDHL